MFVPPDRTAVLVVDLQNDFCSPKGALAADGADISVNAGVAEAAPAFLDAARDAGCLIVWIRQAADEATASPARKVRARTMGRTATTVCARGSWGAELAEPLAPHTVDVVIEKYRYSAFVGTPLELILRSSCRDHVVVCGTAANVCVDSTARDAFMRDFHVTLAADLIGYSRADLGAAALETLSIYFADLADSAALRDRWA